MVEVNTLLVVRVDNIQFDTLHVKSEFFPEEYSEKNDQPTNFGSFVNNHPRPVSRIKNH